MNKLKLNFLNSYRFILIKISMLEDKLAELDDRLYHPKAQTITDMPRGGQRLDALDLVSSKIELQEEINQRLFDALNKKREIERAINQVEDDRYQIVLQLKYIEGYALGEIADRMCYSYTHMTRLHRRALDSLSLKHDT